MKEEAWFISGDYKLSRDIAQDGHVRDVRESVVCVTTSGKKEVIPFLAECTNQTMMLLMYEEALNKGLTAVRVWHQQSSLCKIRQVPERRVREKLALLRKPKFKAPRRDTGILTAKQKQAVIDELRECLEHL